ncbi:flagellar filament capping protein FliD [Duganella callida]|uniref:Flagellar hook-associated protein 2 n=1 Tax=Duganella callida TaxID=2561932 RepID=A0A4Y9SI95_9BURK|nr:flagellar filament capping protein FliD [Duganella callida]TFW20405.1 lateral flagellar hook protein 2 [Duganella callida]
MSVITSPTYDPPTYAEKLAQSYVAGTQAQIDSATAKATATQKGLSTLSSALSAFQSALQDLAGSSNTVSANAATLSNSSIASATAGSKAAPGTYSFYVEQLATAGQVSYNVADSVATNAGAMNVTLADGSSFQVDLANADNNMDGVLSAKEVAAAINAAANNDSRVTASTMTVNGQQKLVLTSAKTGADNAVASIDVSGLNDAGLQASLSSQTTITAAKNAVVWVGGKNGDRVEQASNVFTVVDDVKLTITQAQGASDAPVTLTVAPDNSTTAANVKKFVDAYNALITTIGTLTKSGDHTVASSTDPNAAPSPTAADAAFYNDSGVTNLRDRLGSILRTVTGGQSLISFGIKNKSDGTLEVDAGRLNKALAANPGAIDNLFGRAGAGVDSGVLGAMNKLTTSWTSSTGFLNQRKDQNSKLQADLTDRQATVTNQFNSAYKRYLAQFTALQQLQASMTTTSNMFSAMFSSDSSS